MAEEQQPGTVIYLNGTSSSGKTSLARVLRRQLNDPYAVVSLDNFGDNLHQTVRSLAHAGNNLIVDTVESLGGHGGCAPLERGLLTLTNVPVVFVRVDCALEEAERREKERGNRQIGLARMQFYPVHEHGEYDIVVDTTRDSVEECARQVIEFLQSEATTGGFSRVAEQARLRENSIHEVIRSYHQGHEKKDADEAADCLAATYHNADAGRRDDPASWRPGRLFTRDDFRDTLAHDFEKRPNRYECEIEFLSTQQAGDNACVVTKESGADITPEGKRVGTWENVQNVYHLICEDGQWRILSSLHGVG